MSQEFVSAFMANLAGSGVTLNPTLQSVFASILANQITTNDDGELVFGSSFDTLAQIFTYVATPAGDRPESGILGYGEETLEQAKTDTATEQGVELDDGLTNTNDSRTFTVESDVTSVVEGNTVTFTVTASVASDTDQTVTYQVAGATIAGDENSKATPLSDLGILNGQVTIPAGETTATIELTPASDGSTEGLEGFKVNLLDSDFAVSTSSGTVAIEDPANAGQTFTLTTGSDVAPGYTGGEGDDIFNASEELVGVQDDGTKVFSSHLNPSDVLDGGDGADTLNVTADSAIAVPSMTLKSIETVNIAGGNTVTADLSGSKITGLQSLNVTDATTATLTADDATDVSVSGVSTAANVLGGNDVTIDVDSDVDVVVNDTNNDGSGTYTTGEVNVTLTDDGNTNANGAIAVDGGTNVNVISTISDDGGAIAVGATEAASGDVSVVVNANADGDEAGGLAAGTISVTGGTSVEITANLTTDAADEDADSDVTGGAITVIADDNTADVTIVQNDSVTTYTKAAVAGTTETASVKFGVLKSGDSIEIEDAGDTTGLTFTAAKDLTAEQVAAAFANLTAADLQTAGGVTENGVFSGQLPTDWTSGEASGDTVVFTSTVADTDVDTLDTTLVNSSGNSVDAIVTTTAGAAGTAKDTSTNAAVFGAVRVDGSANDAITTLSVDGYAGAALGTNAGDGADDLDALTTLTLANSAGSAALDTAGTTLTLNVNDVDNAVNIDSGTATVTTLALNAITEASVFGLTANAVTDLTIDAAVDLDIGTGSTLGALENVTVSGAGAVDLGDVSVNTYDSFNASANTGGVTASIETDETTISGDIEEYVFSEGNDVVTATSTTGSAIDSDVSLGDGDDSLQLVGTAADITTAGGTLNGGDGEDTLVMDASDAATASASSAFSASIEGFEKLSIIDTPATAQTVDLANLDNISYVVTANSTANAVAEVFTVDFATSGTIIGGDTIAFDGDTTTLAGGETATQIATAVASGTYGTYTASSSGTVVTFTAQTAGITVDAVTGDFTITDVDATTATGVVNTTTQGTSTYTFDMSNINLNSTGSADTVAIGSYTFTADSDNEGVIDIAADIDNGGAGTTIDGVTYTAAAVGNNLVLTTSDTSAPANLTYTATDVGADAGTYNAGDGSGGANAKATANTEVFTIDLSTSGAIEDADTIVFDGTTITLDTGDSTADIALAVAGQTYANYTATNLGSNVVQFTSKTSGALTDTTLVNFTFNNVTSATTAPALALNVTTQGAAASTAPGLTLDNMADGGTVELTTAGNGVIVNVTDADQAGQDSNVLNVVVSDSLTASGINVGTVEVDDVETVNINLADTFVDANEDGNDDTNAVSTIDVDADAATTINVAGDADTTLTLAAGSTEVDLVDASSLTGILTFTAALADLVVNGGEGNDVLTVSANGIDIDAGAGDDTIYISDDADLVTISGGAGADTFVFASENAASNIDSYAVFDDVGSGDIFDFTGIGDFQVAEVELADGATESSQAYLNQAVKDLAHDDMGWFQFNGNTFIVVDRSDTDAFVDGTDQAVMITGLVDLGTSASFNTTNDTLEIA